MTSLFKSYDITVDVPMKQLLKADLSQFSHRPTPVIATLYDPVVTEYDMKDYLENGLRIARFRLTWISKEDRIKMIGMLKNAIERCCQKYDVASWPIALSVDLPNACVCSGFLTDSVPVVLKENSIVKITCNVKYLEKCDENRIFINDPFTLPTITPGTEIILSFDKIILLCMKLIDNETLKCKVIKEGTLDNQEIVCFRGIKLLKPSVSKRDVDLIDFAKKYKLDMITINCTRSTTSINKVREHFKNKSKMPLVISTICEQEGLDNIDEIIEASDGVILARDYLGTTLTNSDCLFRIQLKIGAKCKVQGKPFYVSGNILERSVKTGVLSGSDLKDVVTAVEQGAGLVLKVYEHPRDTTTALHLLNGIFATADSSFAYQAQLWREPNNRISLPLNAAVACVQASVIAAKAMATSVIIVPTVSGKTIEQLCHYSDNFVILAITTSNRIARQLLIHSGVVSILYKKHRLSNWEEDMKARVKYGASYAVRFHMLQYGESFIVLRKHFTYSAYCDRVCIWKVITEDENYRTTLMKSKPTCRTMAVTSSIIL